MPRYLISNLLGLVGAVIGGVLGFYTFRWLLEQGFYGLIDSGCVSGARLQLAGAAPFDRSRDRSAASPPSPCLSSPIGIARFTRRAASSYFVTHWKDLDSGDNAHDGRWRRSSHSGSAATPDFRGFATRVRCKARVRSAEPPSRSELASDAEPFFSRAREATIPEDRSETRPLPYRFHSMSKESVAMAVTTSAPEPDGVSTKPTRSLRAKQLQQAEELLFSGPEQGGFAKALFRGEFRGSSLFPYPELPESQRPAVEAAVAAVREFADTQIDAAAIDREADIPRSVIDGLAELGVLGMAAPAEWGGRGFSQMGYCRIMEVIGGHCAADGRVRQRPSLDRPAGTGPLRHARAEGALAAAAGQRREARRVRADRRAGRLRRQQRADDGHAHRRTARPIS